MRKCFQGWRAEVDEVAFDRPPPASLAYGEKDADAERDSGNSRVPSLACGVGLGRGTLLVAAALSAQLGPAVAQDDDAPGLLEPEYAEFYGEAAFEGSVFAEDGAFPGQERAYASFAIEPSVLAEWRGGDVALTVTPFYRFDARDERRRHFDLREAKVDWRIGDWEVTGGVDFVFWGRTEAQQLVDVINAVDGVEDIDREDKLGQPMLRVTRFTDFGAFSGFYMPYQRQQTFAGVDGRLRPPFQVNAGDARFENDGAEWSPAFALRWAHVIGDFDLGLHGFHGMSRDPALEVFQVDAFGQPTALRPVYDTITQVGLDGQYTSGPALWKLETIGRFDQLDRNLERQDYWAITAGLEYTLFGVAESNADLGLIVEGAYDTRGDAALTPFNEDAIFGARLALNDEADSSLLFTSSVDLESGGTTLRLEGERRVFDNWRLNVEGNAFLGTDDDDIEASFEDDSFLRLTMTYFW